MHVDTPSGTQGDIVGTRNVNLEIEVTCPLRGPTVPVLQCLPHYLFSGSKMAYVFTCPCNLYPADQIQDNKRKLGKELDGGGIMFTKGEGSRFDEITRRWQAWRLGTRSCLPAPFWVYGC